jgi:DNA-directed RNA polymerase subunit H (RpoH/RPB5)
MSLTPYLTRLGAAKRGALCMMQDRGYVLSEAEQQAITQEPLRIAFDALQVAEDKGCSLGQALSVLYPAPPQSSRRSSGSDLRAAWLVFIDRHIDEKKGREVMVSSAQVRKCMEDCPPHTRLILVLPNKLSPDARKTVAAHAERVQALLCESLFIPLGRHVHVPPHARLTEAEAAEFEAARSLQRYQLPVLLLKDPVSQYYGYAEGDIVRIQRPSGAFYRTVCS